MTKSNHAGPEPGASRSRRGGRRPGAGAPRGNLNALKHGRRSRQLSQLGALLAANPATRAALLELAGRHAEKQFKAEEVAADILGRLFEHAHDIARGVPSRGPFQDLLGLNVQPKRRNVPQSKKAQLEATSAILQSSPAGENTPAVNQPPDTDPPGNQTPDTKTGAQTHDRTTKPPD